MKFAVRSTGSTNSPGGGFIALSYETVSNGGNTTIFKIPLTFIYNDSWFAMIQNSNNTPYNRWIPLVYNYGGYNNFNVDDFIGFAIENNYFRPSNENWIIPKPHDNGTLCEGVVKIDLPNNNALKFKIHFQCCKILIGRYYDNKAYATTTSTDLSQSLIDSGDYYHGSTINSIINTIYPNDFTSSSQSQLSINLNQNEIINAGDINTL